MSGAARRLCVLSLTRALPKLCPSFDRLSFSQVYRSHIASPSTRQSLPQRLAGVRSFHMLTGQSSSEGRPVASRASSPVGLSAPVSSAVFRKLVADQAQVCVTSTLFFSCLSLACVFPYVSSIARVEGNKGGKGRGHPGTFDPHCIVSVLQPIHPSIHPRVSKSSHLSTPPALRLPDIPMYCTAGKPTLYSRIRKREPRAIPKTLLASPPALFPSHLHPRGPSSTSAAGNWAGRPIGKPLQPSPLYPTSLTRET